LETLALRPQLSVAEFDAQSLPEHSGAKYPIASAGTLSVSVSTDTALIRCLR